MHMFIQKATAAIRACRPVLELRYADKGDIYLLGDADGPSAGYSAQGICRLDLRKCACVIAPVAILLFLRLRRL